MARGEVMTQSNTMLAQVQEYLVFRRQLGFTDRSSGEELRLFARYADKTGHSGPITTALAVRWAKLPTNAKPMYWAWRLETVSKFAQHRALEDPRTEVPLRGLLGRSFGRGRPHIYSDDEVKQLIAASSKWGRGMPSLTYPTLFGLLASTGLRVGESLGLKRCDVNLESGVLSIIKTKSAKSRLVPLHISTIEALREYARQRDRIWPHPKSEAFFITLRGTGLKYWIVTTTFRKLRRQLRWPIPEGESAARVHDLRHTFVVRVLIRWYEDGTNVDEKIIHLAAYLGHINPTSTYWYLTAIPELMALTAARFDAYSKAGGIQ